MCLAMYIFTNDVLSQSKWSKDHPGIFIQSITTEDDRQALKWPHKTKNAYYVGGYEGCGCGWSPVSKWTEDEDIVRKQKDRNDLADIIKSINKGTSWLVVCWEGAQGEPLLHTKVITLEDIANVYFEFEELRKYEFA